MSEMRFQAAGGRGPAEQAVQSRWSAKERLPPLTGLPWGGYIGITALGVLTHVFYAFHAGGLWRDEVSSVQLALSPSLGEMWRTLDVPVLFPALVRGWSWFGLGQNDLGLRFFGLLVGLGVLGVLWLNARWMGYRIPYLSLGLVAASLGLVRWGDSLRAYGLGSLFAALMVGQVWRLVQKPDRWRFAAASLSAILSVNCLFQNSVLVAGVCCSAGLVCLLRRQPRIAGLALAVGLLAALSLAPYWTLLAHAGKGWEILRSGFQGRLVLAMLADALNSPPFVGPWIWLGVFIFGIGVGVAALGGPSRAPRVTTAELPLFGAAAAGIATAGFFIFLYVAKLPTQAWYYVPLMVFVAVCLEAALAAWFARRPGSWLAAAGLFTCLAFPFTVNDARQRQTNIDLIARWLDSHASANDLIIVYPWYYGVTFNYYHKGPTPWVTLPDLADHRVHRYDLLKEKLAAADPIQDVLDRALVTVASGHRVWLLGRLPDPQPGERTAPVLPPAPNGPGGWFDEPYTYVWGRQAYWFLMGRGVVFEPVEMELPTAVNPFENPALSRAGAK